MGSAWLLGLDWIGEGECIGEDGLEVEEEIGYMCSFRRWR